MYRFIRQVGMQRAAISIAEHSHGGVAQPAGRADDAAGDFTAVGDQDF